MSRKLDYVDALRNIVSYNVECVRISQHFANLHVSVQVHAAVYDDFSDFHIARHGVEVLNDRSVSHWEEDTILLEPTADRSRIFS